MSHHHRQHTMSAAEDTDTFRGLIDKRISLDEYVKHLDQRVHERENREERPPRDAADIAANTAAPRAASS